MPNLTNPKNGDKIVLAIEKWIEIVLSMVKNYKNEGFATKFHHPNRLEFDKWWILHGSIDYVDWLKGTSQAENHRW